MSEKMGDGWRGSQDVGGGVQAVPVEEAKGPCGREPLHRAIMVDLCDVCLCGLCLPFFPSQNPLLVHGTVPPILLERRWRAEKDAFTAFVRAKK